MKKLFLATLMLSTSLAFSQDSISGIVSDESNNPIPGATIVVQGSNVGVVTVINALTSRVFSELYSPVFVVTTITPLDARAP